MEARILQKELDLTSHRLFAFSKKVLLKGLCLYSFNVFQDFFDFFFYSFSVHKFFIYCENNNRYHR